MPGTSQVIRFIIFALLLGLPGITSAQPRCVKLLIENMRSSNTGISRLGQVLSGPLFKRSLRDPEVKKMVDLLSSYPELNMLTPAQFSRMAIKISKQIEGDTLMIKIPWIFLKDEDNKDFAMNTRPRGLDLRFFKFLAAIFEVAGQDMGKNPRLRNLRLRMESVLSEDLVRMLKSMGFQRNDEEYSRQLARSRMTSRHLFPNLWGPSEIPTTDWREGNPDYNKTWTVTISL